MQRSNAQLAAASPCTCLFQPLLVPFAPATDRGAVLCRCRGFRDAVKRFVRLKLQLKGELARLLGGTDLDGCQRVDAIDIRARGEHLQAILESVTVRVSPARSEAQAASFEAASAVIDAFEARAEELHKVVRAMPDDASLWELKRSSAQLHKQIRLHANALDPEREGLKDERFQRIVLESTLEDQRDFRDRVKALQEAVSRDVSAIGEMVEDAVARGATIETPKAGGGRDGVARPRAPSATQAAAASSAARRSSVGAAPPATTAAPPASAPVPGGREPAAAPPASAAEWGARDRIYTGAAGYGGADGVHAAPRDARQDAWQYGHHSARAEPARRGYRGDYDDKYAPRSVDTTADVGRAWRCEVCSELNLRDPTLPCGACGSPYGGVRSSRHRQYARAPAPARQRPSLSARDRAVLEERRRREELDAKLRAERRHRATRRGFY